MFWFCFFRALVPIFHFKLCSFVGEDMQIFFAPGIWYLSYVTDKVSGSA